MIMLRIWVDGTEWWPDELRNERGARIGVAANQTSENIAAQLTAFRQVVGNGAEVATVAEFGAKVFASEVMLSNLGSLSFDRQFGPVTLKAMFGPAVLPGFECRLNRSMQHRR